MMLSEKQTSKQQITVYVVRKANQIFSVIASCSDGSETETEEEDGVTFLAQKGELFCSLS